MAYLYAGMGIAMLTGIMAMFEMATSYMQFQNTWKPSQASQDLSNEYFRLDPDKDSYAETDRKIIIDMKGKEEKVCEDDYQPSTISDYSKCNVQTSLSGFCCYESGNHRIIFDEKNGLWSCVLALKQTKCDFEK